MTKENRLECGTWVTFERSSLESNPVVETGVVVGYVSADTAVVRTENEFLSMVAHSKLIPVVV